MKKVILSSLIAILALTVAAPALAAEGEGSIRGQQIKELVKVDVVNTDTGVAISFAINEGPIWPTLHLMDAWFEELMGRDWSIRDRVNITTESVTNGFAINIDGTQPQYVEKIQNQAALNLPSRINNILSILFANHGVI
ncbi:hypothetical protein KJ840_01000 [Patescibacteria group bacterium]|nr:hypothetical protein [Patescibacteria group bacterium]